LGHFLGIEGLFLYAIPSGSGHYHER